MPNERATIFEITQIGPESTLGTAVAATRRLQSLQVVPSIKSKTNPFAPQGYKYPGALSVDQEWTEAKVAGILDPAALIYPLAGLFGTVTPVTPTGGTQTRDWVWNPSTSNPETGKTFTIEAGSSVRAAQIPAGLFTGFGATYTREEVKVEGDLIGQRYVDNFTLTAQPSEVQLLTITGSPTGGTFTLTFNGQTTAGIAYNAAAAAVQTALQALTNVGTGNLTCSGGPLPGSTVTFTFAGALAGQHQSLITANLAGLTGGSPAYTITETTPGGMEVLAQPVFPTYVTVYADSTANALGTTALTRPLEASWKIAGKWDPLWTLNATNTSWPVPIEKMPKVELGLTLEADSSGMTYLTNFRAGSSVFLRFASVGATIEGSLKYSTFCDFCAKITSIKDLKDHKGVWAIDYGLEAFQDQVWGQAMSFTVRSTATAL